MAGKRNSKKEESAWQEYLGSVGGEKKEKPHEGISIGERLRQLLERLGIGKREKKEAKKEIAAVKKEIAISAAEAKAKAAQKPVAVIAGKKTKKKAVAGEALRIEKYLARLEERQRAAAAMKEMEEALPKEKPAVKKPALKKPAETKPVLKKPALGKAKPTERKPGTIVSMLRAEARKLFVPKKVALLPKAERLAGAKPGKPAEAKAKIRKAKPVQPVKKARARPKKRKPARKRGAKARREKPARRRRPRKRRPARKRAIAKARVARILPLRPSLARKPISEIKKMPAEEIEKEVKLERIENRARGWFGDVIRHKKAALSGWRLRKRVRLHQLRKKKKAGRITNRETGHMRELIAEDRQLRSRIHNLEDKMRALQRIAKQKKKEERILEKKAKAVGIKLPEEKKAAAKKGREMPAKREDMQDVVKAMRSVANEMAAAATKQTIATATGKDLLTIDDQIKAQQRLIKGLELAFYKRKVDFDQFREKMFDYQSKLSELKIQKGVSKEKMEKMTPAEREAFERQAAARPAIGITPKATIGITPRAAKALEKIAEKEGRKTAAEMEMAAEKKAKGEAEKAEQKKFAERTAEALHKIAQSLGAAPRAQPPPERPTPPPERPTPPPKRPAPPPERPAPAEKPKAERKPEKPKEIVVERVRKKAEEGIPKEEPKAGRIVSSAIKQKAVGSGISKQQIDSIEEKLGKLLEKYGIPDTAVAAHIRTLDSSRLVQDFHKLISLIEAKRESAAAELIRPAPGFDIREGIIARKREKIVGKEKQIRRARIETSFDKVLNIVQVKGIISLNEVARQLQMSKKKAQECAEILEKARLIKLSYPPIGTVKLIYPGYLKWKAEQKRKAREEKKKKAK